MKYDVLVNTETIESRMEGFIPGLLRDNQVPGASIALIRDGKCAWAKGFGVKSVSTGEPVGERTTFQSASFDKPVFAYAAVKLCESGDLSLDESLADHLDAPFVTSDSRLADITLRMVLSHTSGLSHATSPRIVADPGTTFSYSAGGINYLASVIAHLSSASVSGYMAKHILTPLDMQDSCFTESIPPIDVAVGHDHQGCPLEAKVGTTVATLYITAADYAKFMIQFMKPKLMGLIAEMLTPQVHLNEAISWGLGWGQQEGSEGPSYWHWGGGNTSRALNCLGATWRQRTEYRHSV
jgi:CubicO group peptidase (beta-lactamase class C family)